MPLRITLDPIHESEVPIDMRASIALATAAFTGESSTFSELMS
jgi:hypothetical protein